MIDSLIALLSGTAPPNVEGSPEDLKFSVAALLIEAARMDRSFDAAERATIGRLLAARFDLAPDAIRSLIDAAERRVESSAQYYPFTREICARLSIEERTEIIEMLWKVAYADGTLDPYEDALLRQIAGLIHVPDKDRGLARQRALAELGITRAGAGKAE